MKIRIYKKHWDAAKKHQMSNIDYDSLRDCLLGKAIKDTLPDARIEGISFCHATINGIRYISTDVARTTELVRQWCYNIPEGRASLPRTIEFKEAGY